MDDLAGLSWSTTPSNPPKPSQSSTSTSPFANLNPPVSNPLSSLRPSPSPFASGRNTPLSTQGSGNVINKPVPTSAKPAQDSFSNLLNFGTGGKNNANLSLRQRQELLEAEKRRKEEEKRQLAQQTFGEGHFFDSLASRSQSASSLQAPPAAGVPTPLTSSTGSTRGAGVAVGAQKKTASESDEDLFAAFRAETKVDNSSYFPPPTTSEKPTPAKAPALDLTDPNAWGKPPASGPGSGNGSGGLLDDDDPFGLSQLQAKPSAPAAAATAVDEEDDLLGDLAKPVEEIRKKREAERPAFSRQPQPGKPIEDSSSDSEPERPGAPTGSDDPFDRAVAQIMEYGFSAEDARRSLTESGAGINVQVAVNWLLDDAHRKAKDKAKARSRAGDQPSFPEELPPRPPRNGTSSWIREESSRDSSRSRDNRSPASFIEGDLAKTAAAMGTQFLKTANNLWKQGQKKVQKAVAEFQNEGDPSQPKWMRSAATDRLPGDMRDEPAQVTDEALMLEAGGPPPKPKRPSPESRAPSEVPSRERSPALPPRPGQAPRWQHLSQPPLDSRSRLNRLAAEEESFQAYVSPARRKKTMPQPQPEPKPKPSPSAEPEPDLLFGVSSPAPAPTTRPTPQSHPSPAPTPAAQKPKPAPSPARPARQIPQVSPAALQTSTKHRLEGTSHFKRGDFAAAHTSYTLALSSLPSDHPLTIVLLTNRALTSLKTGEPRQAISDADAALQIIGPNEGKGETVEVINEKGETERRDMRELFGKALVRKAEALEQIERWEDAGRVWQRAVEGGVGGQVAITGKQRCAKALAPKQSVTARSSPAPSSAKLRPSVPARSSPALRTPTIPPKDSEALKLARAVHEAAERENDEKFQLTDKVDARISAWRDGKRDNLRALLTSLDTVLWEGSGWKKVSLHELVMPNKVKVMYMKAVAKTHPDKLPQNATTEMKMIAGLVFSTLNEAWDKFKAENNM
ncbi:uncharacterized protein CTHT_0065230 [Thermochaetoides thermophila DSM 1495]|uniref:UBA domain-containing protein n=1 Tax=Chaetomium thermophilum (strain DSM 1495 / CBS 144.50 / IMI 039719) TaxID=759272 RepID=G0SG67_CHATD|nr:hypothetical protein CTHT_0065230 [Thermochaetoides thermophila DSM 1495]EGS17206.1 hypothetical protein CTHT_0065230 [Thermochaetoides thermophila DSM 1495]